MASWRKIRKEIQSISDRYLVAVSGGIDSMFLLDFMRNSNVYFQIVHFDHGIREDSGNDLKLIHEYADKYDLIVWSSKSTSLTSNSCELDARTARWSFIESVARENGFSHVVTAHHADDQIENVFIRLMRGDPHFALAMSSLTEINGIIRYKPLLSVMKSEIQFQANRLDLKWNEDSTNSDERYDRNFVRNSLLPMLANRTNISKAILTGIGKTKE